MAGYLDQYGAGDERREKRNRWILISGASALLILFLWFFFFVWDKTEILRSESLARLAQVLRNHRQEGRVKSFVEDLQRRDYQAAYGLWGCSVTQPCQSYPFAEFMKDWGPGSVRNPSSYTVVKSRSCGNGVIVTVDFGPNQEDALWVQRKDLILGFSPFPVCAPGS